jgi:hypothetical protein
MEKRLGLQKCQLQKAPELGSALLANRLTQCRAYPSYFLNASEGGRPWLWPTQSQEVLREYAQELECVQCIAVLPRNRRGTASPLVHPPIAKGYPLVVGDDVRGFSAVGVVETSR